MPQDTPQTSRPAQRIDEIPLAQRADPGLPQAYPSAPQALQYSRSGGRPGLVTAIGVLSIVFASMGLLTAVVTTMQGVAFYSLSQMAASMPGPAAAPRLAGSASPAALPADQVDSAIAGLAQVRPLSTAQREHLAALLSESGRDVFVVGDGSSAEVFAALVSAHGRYGPELGDEREGIYYILGRGRLEVYENEAAFHPLDGRPPIHVSAADIAGSLTEPQIAAVIAKVQGMVGQRLTAAQAQALRGELSLLGQGLIEPSPTPELTASQIISAEIWNDGSLFIQSTEGHIQINPQGQVTQKWVFNAATGPGPGTPFPFRISALAAGLFAGSALLNLGMAVLLLVAGILMIRSVPRSVMLHRLYAAIKIPLAIAGGYFSYWLMAGIFASLSGGPPPGLFVFGLMWAILGCAYPVALLIALRSRTVRGYFTQPAN